MKIMEQPDGLEGYVVLVEEDDLKHPLALPELKGNWADIINKSEGAVLKGGLFHLVVLTTNSFGIELLIPDAEWLPTEMKLRILEHLI